MTCRCASPATSSATVASLYLEHREAVIAHLQRRVPPAEAEDLAQEVFAKAGRAWSSFRGDASPRTWLLRIATRTALDHLRSRRHHEARRTDSLSGDDSGSSIGTPSLATPAEAPRRLVQKEMHACVREFVDRLPAPHREVLVLKDLDGLTNAMIAERLGVSVEAAKIRLHRARQALRTLLDRGCEYYRTEQDTLGCDRRQQRVGLRPPRC